MASYRCPLKCQQTEAEALAARIRQFQFRDIRPKAASDIADLASAAALLGHTEQELTRKVYVRVKRHEL